MLTFLLAVLKHFEPVAIFKMFSQIACTRSRFSVVGSALLIVTGIIGLRWLVAVVPGTVLMHRWSVIMYVIYE